MDVIFSLDTIKQAAAQFLADTAGTRVFAFHGEMGAGKTTFIHALCEAMGVQDTISSPTFSIINEYATGDGSTVYHMDLYRIRDAQEAINAGVEDCLYSGATCLVEWPERTPGIFPADTLHVYLHVDGTNTRKLNYNL